MSRICGEPLWLQAEAPLGAIEHRLRGFDFVVGARWRWLNVDNDCVLDVEKVVTPFSPTDWQLTFDGETVSLYPSIGNWSFPCQSYYWIKENQVRWAPRMSREEIETGRAADRARKDQYFGRSAGAAQPGQAQSSVPGGFWATLSAWLRLYAND